jgi:predicted transposase/invertase (TIGR01784 family)
VGFVLETLFADPKRAPLLLELLNAVFRPPRPFVAVKAQAREHEVGTPDRKVVRIDVVATLRGGLRVLIEMQLVPPDDMGDRVLFYWASLHAETLDRSVRYRQGPPTYALAILAESIDRAAGLHATYRVTEERTGSVLSEKLRIDVLQLGELEPLDKRGGRRQTRVELLARFFRAESVEELENLATEYPLMAKLVEALEDVSKSSDMREALRAARASAIFAQQEQLRKTDTAHAEGHAKGKAEGKAEGLAEGKAEGKAEGLAEGKAEGLAEGLAEGKLAAKREIAANMLAQGLARELVEAAVKAPLADLGL